MKILNSIVAVGFALPITFHLTSCGASIAHTVAGDNTVTNSSFPYGFKGVVWSKSSFAKMNQLYSSGKTRQRGVATLSADIQANMSDIGKINILNVSETIGGWDMVGIGRTSTGKPYGFRLKDDGKGIYKFSDNNPTEEKYSRIMSLYQ